MATASSTSITVRVQAKEAVSADDIGGSEVTFRDAQTGEWLAGGLALGTDQSPLYSSNASLSAIVTPPDPPGGTPTVWWFTPDTATGLIANLEISRPNAPRDHRLRTARRSPVRPPGDHHPVDRARAERGPGARFRSGDPGLLVQVMEPATHLAILSTSLPYTVPFQVNVMMMCGCQIKPGQPWIPSDFAVTVAIGQVGQPPSETVLLTFPGTAPSLFTGSWQVPVGASGFFQAVITAVQLSKLTRGLGW